MGSDYENDTDSEDSEGRVDRGFTTTIFTTLEQVKTPSAFAYSTIDSSLSNPVLHVPPHGTLGLPLSTDDAQKIISQARQSPFGKGEETLVDTTVRKSWELNPDQFSLKNPSWIKAIETIVDTVTTQLGLAKEMGKVSAQIHKLLLYETGAFFKPHKDSEKAPGMFATLVVCLPSPHEGGKLVMTLDDEKLEFETASSSSYGCSYAAWYADITHEVLPVVSGYRLMLTYNLVRQTDFVIPSYNLVRGHVQQLSTLLVEYNLRLEEGDDKLPPILLHKLKHKYTQVNLKMNTLKPPDFAQVQTLRQLSSELGFDIYLATLELSVRKEDGYDDSCDERSQELKNVVELDGTLIVESLEYPDGALIDPTGQDERVPYKEEYEDYTGNEGSPVTYWYRDTVAVLVPPAKELNFIFKFGAVGSVIEPLFNKRIQELSQDPTQKPKLEQLCELALKRKPTDNYSYNRFQCSDSFPPYFKQAVATALDLGRIDLLDDACKTTSDKIMLDYAGALGGWAAKNGVAAMTDRLMKGVRVASSVAKKVEFLKAVAEGFDTIVQEQNSAERVSLKQWSDAAIFTAMAEHETLTKADVMSLVQLCKTMDWSLFESRVKPIVFKVDITTKIAFVDELMSTLQQEPEEEQRSFIKVIIRNIWTEFVFDRSDSFKENNLNLNGILHIVETTITILSSECVETTIIPGMLTAIPIASKKSTKELFVQLVQMILKNELVGFRLPTNDTVPPPLHKRLVQALLVKFLSENVSPEPRAPTDWSFPTRSCVCSDCSMVNRFLQDPRQVSFDLKCVEGRRKHLNRTFDDYSRSSYDITIIRGTIPLVWRITKTRRGYETARSKWIESTKSAKQTLSKLKSDKAASGRLEAYLEPYYSVIMNANVKELPDLKSLVAMPQLPENNENAASAFNQPTNETGLKRGASDSDLGEDDLAKRPKS